MGSIKLAANLISTTEGRANWGHLQIINTSIGREIEVQSYSFDAFGQLAAAYDQYLIDSNEESWLQATATFVSNSTQAPSFYFRDDQSHSEFTTFAPGSGTYDPAKYKAVDIDIGNRTDSEFWETLKQVNDALVSQSPNYLYGLGQNSNSYATTLLWMMGIDTVGLLSAVRPSAVTGMSNEQAAA